MRKNRMNDNTWMYAEMPAGILKNKSLLMRLVRAGNRLAEWLKRMMKS